MKGCLALIAALTACGADKYGAYFHVTSSTSFDRLEFFFGSGFPSRKCDGSLSTRTLPINATAKWDRTTEVAANDTIWRRQFHADDIVTVTPGTAATYYVPDDANNAEAGFDDTLGGELVVVATVGAPTAADPAARTVVGVAKLDGFSVPTGEVDRYEVTLDAPFDGLELWGLGDGPSCLRWADPAGSTFIVREYDHDCDGLTTNLCNYDGTGATWNDCDPLAFCHPDSTSKNCVVHDSCYANVTMGGVETTCNLGTCANTMGGPLVCTPTLDVCLGENACSQRDHCDRKLLTCVLGDSTPDVTCQVPVHDGTSGTIAGALCTVPPGTTAPVAMFPLAITGSYPCGIVREAGPRSSTGTLDLGFTMVTNTQPVECDLVASPLVQGATPVLPTTRLLVSLATGVVTGAPAYGTLLVELQPVPGDCTMPVTCATAAPATPPLGVPHTCP